MLSTQRSTSSRLLSRNRTRSIPFGNSVTSWLECSRCPRTSSAANASRSTTTSESLLLLEQAEAPFQEFIQIELLRDLKPPATQPRPAQPRKHESPNIIPFRIEPEHALVFRTGNNPNSAFISAS